MEMECDFESGSDIDTNEDVENGFDEENYWQDAFKKTLNFLIWKWALKNNITHVALSELLKILVEFGHISLPKDSRTLLRTPKQVDTTVMGSGQLWYRGLKERLTQICVRARNNCSDVLRLVIHIDGIPIYNSSKSECWPIQCSIRGIVMKAFFVALHYGPSKPKSAEEYLRPLINELNELLENGLVVIKNGLKKLYTVTIDKFIMDAPARQFSKCIIGHSGYFSCERCTEEGYYIFQTGEKNDRNKVKETSKQTKKGEICECKSKGCSKKKGPEKSGHVCLTGSNASLRTNLSFRTKQNEEHHHDTSPLEDLPIDMIRDIVLDYLHLILFGIVKKLLNHWMKGTRNFRTKFSDRDITEISEKLIAAGKTCPTEINRPNRSLRCLSDWKATEYRTFLLKTGPVVLKGHLPEDAYNHFLALHCAATICCSESLLIYLPVAKKLFREFNQRFGEIYGEENYTYSFHSIIHVTDDVERFGVMDGYSAFPGESNLGHLKKLVRGGNKPLQQIVKRLKEREIFEDLFGDIEAENDQEKGLQKNILRLKDIRLDCSEKNRWILTQEKKIFKINGFSEKQNTTEIHGSVLRSKNQKNLYEVPIQSSNLGIFKSKLEGRNVTINLEDIYCKLYRIDLDNGEAAFFPLFHFTQ